MQIENAMYRNDERGNKVSIAATIDGRKLSIPIDSSNRHYAELLRRDAEEGLVIAEAEIPAVVPTEPTEQELVIASMQTRLTASEGKK